MTAALALILAAQEIPAVSAAIERAITQGQLPGAVCLIGTPERTIHRRAYGWRSLEAPREVMTVDTIFDVASLTKVVATTSGIAKLYESGRLELDAPVQRYLPEYPRSAITLRHLLTHVSGLRPDLDLEPAWSGYETGIRLAIADPPRAAPNEKFAYSDINFLLLGEIVQRLSGRALPEFVRQEVFAPLGMTDTMFQPPAALRPRIAPTEKYPGMRESLRGVVHDPTARFMGGVAGHAGLFTTVDDLAKFARMMLSGGGPVFRGETIERFTSPQSPPHLPVRGLGWDIDSPYSTPRGDLFRGGYGHTGFTGASIWIEPSARVFVILLANAVHPVRRPPISALRRAVATEAARALGAGQTLTGIDVLEADRFAPLRGRRVGLITNHTGLTRDGRRNVDAMIAGGVTVTALFSPEHGLAGKEDHEQIGDTRDEKTGLRVWSLYNGEQRRPSPASLTNVDVLVFDIQDIGTRFYTYLSTMVNAMEEAARRKLPFVVLDRPNPITGRIVEGPMLDPGLVSFVGIRPLPLRHGMTLGELARMLNAEIGADLQVIAMRNWSRHLWWDQTGLTWVNPSPNMKTLYGALLYPGVALLEFNKNYSVGRGAEAPFEQIGADWIEPARLAAELNARWIPGIRAYPQAGSVRLIVTDRDRVQASLLGIEIASALLRLYPGRIDLQACARLIGSQRVIAALQRGDDPRTILQAEDLQPFLKQRAKYLLYD